MQMARRRKDHRAINILMGFPNTWNKRALKFVVQRLIIPATFFSPQLEVAKNFLPL